MNKDHDLNRVDHRLTSAAAVPSSRPRVKERSGWFPAGYCVRRARSVLSDGAFKLYISICLDADASTGRFEASHKDLAMLLRKSKRIIGVYIREIEAMGVCCVLPARNQHARTLFQVCDAYWPYHRADDSTGAYDSDQEQAVGDDHYVARLRKYFLDLECVSGSFTAADERFVRELKTRGIAVETVESAILMAAVRKYTSWLNNGPSAPIARLRYVESLLGEIQHQPWPPGYRDYLEMKLNQFTKLWRESRLTWGISSDSSPQPSSAAPAESAGAKK